ncbi:tryptophan synthase subunit beta [Methanospirillum stamsii]|uniref:Tryptophan synthase beta chain n=1 Tax=Methanospirillum stamsii TaxID=1277351 RepID=A0A2V2MWW0_9EURY|nr:tryptophan synthase subunit beta [Methanospirillum stamsii]PWR72392.1 tryptophan synthase subunit beta [Methanospirillum stamsii]
MQLNTRLGPYGGCFVPETLMGALEELESAYINILPETTFQTELSGYLTTYAGRETPLTLCRNMSRDFGCTVYLKREDLLHSGAHKLNNALGQGLLAKHMGKKRLIAETGAGQHGVATAIAGAVLGLEVDVFMGEVDIKRQSLNVARMNMMGARVIPVSSGTRTLKDAMNEALREWVARVNDTHYLIGTVAGPHPYPVLVRDLQRIIGDETKRQIMAAEGRLPDVIIACIGGGSNAIGMFHPFISDASVRMYGVEAGGEGLDKKHGASLCGGKPGILHGNFSYLLQDTFGQIIESHSISAGLDYPGVGPEHAMHKDSGRVTYAAITDTEAMEAFLYLSRTEGIVPALESSHAVAFARKIAPELGKNTIMIINLSGRGDKDVETVLRYMEDKK